MHLSIIIPSYNRPDLLHACLSSIHQQAAKPTQIIVVDDASTAGSIGKVARAFADVELITLTKNAGFCAAINAGLRRARAPVVQLLNDDTIVLPGWTEAPIQRLADDRTVASVAPLVLRWPDGTIIDSAGDGYDPGGFAYSRGRGQPISPRLLKPEEVFSASGCGAFFRKDLLLAIGGFPERFRAYFDDIAVGARLRQLGYRCWYEPESRILHHGSASHARLPRRQMVEQIACNEERLFYRQFSARRKASHVFRHGAVLSAKAWRRWADGSLAPFLTGRLRAWSEVVLHAKSSVSST
jgi:GT2 family glycosyltransferase